MWPRLLVFACYLACLPVVAAQAPQPKPIENPTAADLQGGVRTYITYCARCHGLDGNGGTGPPLARPRLRRAADEAAIIAILIDGVPGTSMLGAWSLSEREITQVAAYVRSLGQRPEEPLPGDPDTRSRGLRPRGLRDVPHRRWRGLRARARSDRRRRAARRVATCASR